MPPSPSRSTVSYQPGAKEPSDETKKLNDKRWLFSADRPSSAKNTDARPNVSDAMWDVMKPPADCAMSDKFCRSSRAAEDSRSTSGVEGRVHMPNSARASRSVNSEASFNSAADREMPHSTRSSTTGSVASADGFRPNREASEASFASSGVSGYSSRHY